jgi:hypothetical protein
MTRADFKIGIDGYTQSIINLPRHVEQLLGKVLCGPLHERTVVSARRKYAHMIQVLIEHKSVHRCKLIQISFCGSFELDLRGELDLIARPAFNGD